MRRIVLWVSIGIPVIASGCASGGNGNETSDDGGGSCRQVGEKCVSWTDCCSESCAGTCQPPDPSGEPTSAGDAGPDAGPPAACSTHVQTDVANCGRCGNACTAKAPNEAPVCVAGACHTTCKPGFAVLHGKCVNFAGAYEKSDPGCAACADGDSYTSTCGCPTGTAATSSLRVINDCNGSHGALVSFCGTNGASPEADWAGVYEEDDPVSCSEGCRFPNPHTKACSCPPGATAIPLDTVVDTKCSGVLITSHIVVCANLSVPVTTFGGVYQVNDGGACRFGNPRTSGCSCPSGTSAHPIRALSWTANGALLGSNIYVCTSP